MLKSPVVINSWGVVAAEERKELKSSNVRNNSTQSFCNTRMITKPINNLGTKPTTKLSIPNFPKCAEIQTMNGGAKCRK